MKLSIEISLRDKFKLLREHENLSQQKLADILNTKKTTIASFESGANKTIGSNVLLNLINHTRFKPYVEWLITQPKDLRIAESGPQYSTVKLDSPEHNAKWLSLRDELDKIGKRQEAEKYIDYLLKEK